MNWNSWKLSKHAVIVMFAKLGGGLKIRGALTAREQSPQQNNRMQPEAQRSKKGAPRPLAKLLIHHDSWAARWAFLNQMVLVRRIVDADQIDGHRRGWESLLSDDPDPHNRWGRPLPQCAAPEITEKYTVDVEVKMPGPMRD